MSLPDLVWEETSSDQEMFTAIRNNNGEHVLYFKDNYVPDFIFVPNDCPFPMSGRAVEVMNSARKKCPRCDKSVLHLLIGDASKGNQVTIYCVARCPDHLWQFYSQTFDTSHFSNTD